MEVPVKNYGTRIMEYKMQANSALAIYCPEGE